MITSTYFQLYDLGTADHAPLVPFSWAVTADRADESGALCDPGRRGESSLSTLILRLSSLFCGRTAVLTGFSRLFLIKRHNRCSEMVGVDKGQPSIVGRVSFLSEAKCLCLEWIDCMHTDHSSSLFFWTAARMPTWFAWWSSQHISPLLCGHFYFTRKIKTIV